MNLLYAFVTLMAIGAFGVDYTPDLEEYIFNPRLPLLSQLNIIDAIPLTNATATSTSNRFPTKEQIIYYNYYAAVNYFYDLQNLTCEYCEKIKPDIADHKVFYNGTHNTLAMVALSNTRKEIVVSFRGSANSWNLVLDFAFLFNVKERGNIKVHAGFYIATMSLYEHVVQAIAYYRQDHPNYKIVITGLSLGGAMARMTLFFLKDRNQFDNATYELYTFGEFRVGNIYFAEYMNSLNITSVRVVHRADIICHLPPVTVLGTNILYDFYFHPQNEYWINGSDGQKFCSQNVYEDASCSNSIGPAYSLVDHFTYFDVNIAGAFAQPLQLASIAFNILPVETSLPPLPKFIGNPLEDLLNTVIGGLVPSLG
ncbi:Lipase [Pseudolycoriella hygida]|uniref:Lipase n=1 Tax=Pseudolycoriella hygida TaxID=35572 RepID=A0A9Q0S9Z7_9DIPT|nr:Lipase [Pseudolycoriella hygida]